MTLGEAFMKSPAYEEFVQQYKGSDGSIRSVAGLKSAEFDVKGGFYGTGQKDVVTGASSTSGGAFVVNDRYGVVTDLIGQRRLTVRDLCTNVTTSSDTFEFVRVTGKTNNAAGVAEATTSADGTITFDDPDYVVSTPSGTKPESAMTFEVASTPVETIAHLMPLTRRAAADAPQVRQLVDAFLLYGLKEEEEDQILNGSGTSPALRGILQTANISTVGSAGTDIDAIVDSAGNYLIGDPSRSVDQLQALWGLRVVVTPAMTENTALVADFSQCIVADREQSAIYVTDSHKDWFGRNLLAVLAEERLAFAVLDPDAICTVTSV